MLKWPNFRIICSSPFDLNIDLTNVSHSNRNDNNKEGQQQKPKKKKKKMKQFLKALGATAVILSVPFSVAATYGMASLTRNATKSGNNKRRVVKEATFYASSFVLPSPIVEVVGLAGRL